MPHLNYKCWHLGKGFIKGARSPLDLYPRGIISQEYNILQPTYSKLELHFKNQDMMETQEGTLGSADHLIIMQLNKLLIT